MKNFCLSLGWMAALALQSWSQAHASVVINGTRIIYPGAEREVSVRLTNDGSLPALVQSWVDSGDARQLPEQSDAPFLLTPPVIRVDPGKGQTLRLMADRVKGATDKEAVFWLNVLEIPPAPSGEQAKQNTLQMAFRTRIKIFYRPAGLSDAGAAKAPEQLHWRAVHNGDTWALECSNTTGYHVSFSSVSLANTTFRNSQGGMIAPGATLLFPMEGLTHEPPAGASVAFEIINDFGGVTLQKAVL